jgi:hypothetical protein
MVRLIETFSFTSLPESQEEGVVNLTNADLGQCQNAV